MTAAPPAYPQRAAGHKHNTARRKGHEHYLSVLVRNRSTRTTARHGTGTTSLTESQPGRCPALGRRAIRKACPAAHDGFFRSAREPPDEQAHSYPQGDCRETSTPESRPSPGTLPTVRSPGRPTPPLRPRCTILSLKSADSAARLPRALPGPGPRGAGAGLAAALASALASRPACPRRAEPEAAVLPPTLRSKRSTEC